MNTTTQSPIAPQILTLAEAAAMLRLEDCKEPERTVRRYIADGRLTGIKIGRSMKVYKSSVDHFIRSGA